MASLRTLIFFSVVGSVTVLVHIYLYRRLVRDVTSGPRRRRLGKLLMGLLWLMLFSALPIGSLWRNEYTSAFGAAAWSWMGLAIFLASSLVLVEVIRLVAWLGWRVSRGGRAPHSETPAPAAAASAAPGGPLSIERRIFLSRAIAGGAVAASGGLAGYGLWRAYTPPSITELALKLPRLPRALDGLTIVHLTDIHVGALIQRRFMEEMVRQCNALKPDLVAITGDMVDGSVPMLMPSVSALTGLSSRFGTYFITGNHEYYSGDQAWCEALEKMGVTALRNRTVSVGDAGASFDLVGVDDWSAMRDRGRGYDLEKAIAGRDPARAAVLLAHQPRNFEGAAEKGIGLQLSGHTHGGQMFPGTLLIPMLWQQPAGHYTHGESHLYVSRGTGFWGPPMRVGSEPEIVKLTLLAG